MPVLSSVEWVHHGRDFRIADGLLAQDIFDVTWHSHAQVYVSHGLGRAEGVQEVVYKGTEFLLNVDGVLLILESFVRAVFCF